MEAADRPDKCEGVRTRVTYVKSPAIAASSWEAHRFKQQPVESRVGAQLTHSGRAAQEHELRITQVSRSLEVQKGAILIAEPGVDSCDVDLRWRRAVGELLQQLSCFVPLSTSGMEIAHIAEN